MHRADLVTAESRNLPALHGFRIWGSLNPEPNPEARWPWDSCLDLGLAVQVYDLVSFFVFFFFGGGGGGGWVAMGPVLLQMLCKA